MMFVVEVRLKGMPRIKVKLKLMLKSENDVSGGSDAADDFKDESDVAGENIAEDASASFVYEIVDVK